MLLEKEQVKGVQDKALKQEAMSFFVGQTTPP
jgi:hypothetical protein